MRNAPRTKHTYSNAQSIVELAVGLLILIPVFLAILDLIVLLQTGNINGDLAKSAARAAASSPDAGSASTAATALVNNFPLSSTITVVKLTSQDWGNAKPGYATATTEMTTKLPVPIPGLPQTYTFDASFTQPIVSVEYQPPQQPGG